MTNLTQEVKEEHVEGRFLLKEVHESLGAMRENSWRYVEKIGRDVETRSQLMRRPENSDNVDKAEDPT